MNNFEKQPHATNIAIHKKPFCGAKTRQGKPCQSPPVTGKKRCRMHGGAKGSGAPLGNKNAWKFGYYSRTSQIERKSIRNLIRYAKKTIISIHSGI